MKWATLSDGDPDTGQTATQRSRRGQASLLDSPHQLSHSGLLRTIETSRLQTYFSMGSFHLKMLAKRGKERNFNFLSMSEFPLTKSCLPSPRLAAEVGLAGGPAGEAATDTASTVLNPT